MKALISPIEQTIDYMGNVGIRVAQVVEDKNIFDVANPLYWIDCPDNCVADQWYFIENQLQPLPQSTVEQVTE